MRKFVLTMLVPLMLAGVTGCGSGKFTGTLCEYGCGYPPTPPAGDPVVTSLSPASIAAGGPAFTLTVRGKNFKRNMLVGGINATSTTYLSSTEMQAQIPASAIAEPTTITVIAVTSPPLSLNFGADLTVTDAPLLGNSGLTISNVAILANDMVWNPSTQQLYLSVPGSSTTNANTITTLNPANGQIGISQAAGSEPDRLALSSDGLYLYAGLDGAGSVQRFTLPGLGTDINIPIGSAPNLGPYYAMDVEVAPGSPHTIAVVRGILPVSYSPLDWGGVAIYDDAVARPNAVSGGYYVIPSTDILLGNITAIQWKPDAGTIYGTGDNFLDVLSVNSSGVQATNAYQNLSGGFGPHFHYDATTGYMYSEVSGNVVNPSTGALVGTFPVLAAVGGNAFYGVMVPDGLLNVAYFIGYGNVQQGTPQYTLEAFDMTNFTLLGAVAIPNVVGNPVDLVRWGSNGLALLTNQGFNGPVQGTGVYLISGAFVTTPSGAK